jgi:hypothetical protein
MVSLDPPEKVVEAIVWASVPHREFAAAPPRDSGPRNKACSPSEVRQRTGRVSC